MKNKKMNEKSMSWFPSASEMQKLNELNDKIQEEQQKKSVKLDCLLLQIDSCKEFNFGDGGQINVFINSKDLKEFNFEKCVMEL